MIRVFIIDDNVMVRFALAKLLDQEIDMTVVGDGPADADLEKHIRTSKPDILIFDIPLPRHLGIQELKNLKRFRLPSIVFTHDDPTITKDLIPLLEVGAVGFVTKPAIDTQILDVRAQLIHEIRLNVRSKDSKTTKPTAQVSFFDPPKVVAIGSSTGGPEALVEVLSQIGEGFPAGVVIVQHMPAGFTTKFAQRLDHASGLTIKEAENGDVIKAGCGLLAPGDFHMTFTPYRTGRAQSGQVKLTKDPAQWGLRPTVDRMMTSLATIFGRRIVGVILTGMGQDGVIGMRAIKESGGKTLVQDKHSSVVFGMAQEVIKNNLADEVHPLNQIASRIKELV